MREKLPIPIFLESGAFTDVDVEAPASGVFADTKKVADSGDVYSAMIVFLSGCITAIYSETSEISDKVAIKSAIRKMPYRSAEYISLRAMRMIHDGDDGIEGVYKCPVCDTKVIARVIEEDGEIVSDTRDFVSMLDVVFMPDGEQNIIGIDLEIPAEVKDARTSDAIAIMRSFVMDHPTLGHCVQAVQKIGMRDDIRLQNQIYIEAIRTVDGNPVDASWKAKYAALLFDRIKNINDLIRIAREAQKYGVDRRVSKTCPECGKNWRAIINTSNFFVSALPDM